MFVTSWKFGIRSNVKHYILRSSSRNLKFYVGTDRNGCGGVIFICSSARLLPSATDFFWLAVVKTLRYHKFGFEKLPQYCSVASLLPRSPLLPSAADFGFENATLPRLQRPEYPKRYVALAPLLQNAAAARLLLAVKALRRHDFRDPGIAGSTSAECLYYEVQLFRACY